MREGALLMDSRLRGDTPKPSVAADNGATESAKASF